ncbi:carph-isopro domain-containing protein [Mesorhizobium sp.]|uniref:carph-isopro domain-containing protein n=1 Tax=Mesorhizobium sp. TaxID=1871066 RepID=UPI00343A4343
MQTVHDIFEALGGTGAVARVIGVKHSAASEMRRRQSIPVKYWPALMSKAAEERIAIDSDVLVRVHVSAEQGRAA